MQRMCDNIILRTKRLTVRLFRADDLDPLYRLLSDPEVMRFLEPPFSRQQTADFLEHAGLCEPPLVYAVEDAAGEFVGYVIWHPYEQGADEIGWVLCREYWHKGYAQELTEAMIAGAHGRTDSLVIECLPEQLATRRLALKNGFVYDGKSGVCDVYRRRV